MDAISKRKILIAANCLIAVLFSGAIGVMPLLSVTPDGTLLEKTAAMYSAVIQIVRTVPIPTASAIIIPLLAAITCAAGLSGVLLSSMPKSYYRAMLTTTCVVAAFTLIASVLTRDLPILAVTLVPLSFASYSARRAVSA